ncbi:hypothetical protein ACIRU3_19410 [Streptomyces sp. NPDC101151]|uniref:hypothetical protein n=1 Tax=Streptomyces sp. NPDC101151 TaxID=3366115 RepID=UPI00382BD7F6
MVMQPGEQSVGPPFGGGEFRGVDLRRPQFTGRGVVGVAQFHDRHRQTHLDQRGRGPGEVFQGPLGPVGGRQTCGQGALHPYRCPVVDHQQGTEQPRGDPHDAAHQPVDDQLTGRCGRRQLAN